MTPYVVYDTMLFFQAAAQPARLRTSIEAIRNHWVRLCLSSELIAEIQDVLNRPELQAKFPALQPDMVEAFINDMLTYASIIDPVPNSFTWPQHPDDDHLFNLAIAAKANYLVTWESRILRFANETTPPAFQLRQLAPQLSIITPADLTAQIKPKGT